MFNAYLLISLYLGSFEKEFGGSRGFRRFFNLLVDSIDLKIDLIDLILNFGGKL